MQKDFWLDRWKEHQIGFHKESINENLINFFSHLQLQQDDHIFVPLCGKSLDMLWLAQQGLHVTGVELSEIAIQEFFKESNLEYSKSSMSGFNIYSSGLIKIFEGDIFDLTHDLVGKIDGIYDRAATVALPEFMRDTYLRKLLELMPAQNTLMVLLEYQQELVAGPPFSVSEEFIHSIFSKDRMTKLKDKLTDNVSSKFKEVGAIMKETVYVIKHEE